MPDKNMLIGIVIGGLFVYFLLPRITPVVYAALGKGGS